MFACTILQYCFDDYADRNLYRLLILLTFWAPESRYFFFYFSFGMLSLWQHGAVYKLAFGPKAFVVVSDPIVARHILRENAFSYDKVLVFFFFFNFVFMFCNHYFLPFFFFFENFLVF